MLKPYATLPVVYSSSSYSYHDVTNNPSSTFDRTVREKEYDLNDHLGNVSLIFSDWKQVVGSSSYATEILATNNYYPFGMLMPGYTNAKIGGTYRYGYNDKEKDDDIKGTGNSYDFGARMYDSRLGRFLSLDPLANKYPDNSPFNFAVNTPIQAKDPDGNIVLFFNGQNAGTGGTSAYWAGFDDKFMEAVGDKTGYYIDGGLGGWENTYGKLIPQLKTEVKYESIGFGGFIIGSIPTDVSVDVETENNLSVNARFKAGQAAAVKYKEQIYNLLDKDENGQVTESIKAVTNSMGAVFMRGFFTELQKDERFKNLTYDILLDIDSWSYKK